MEETLALISFCFFLEMVAKLLHDDILHYPITPQGFSLWADDGVNVRENT
jgi:hypothetical protein